MNAYTETNLRIKMRENQEVTVTVVPFEDPDGAHGIIFTNIDEAINEINSLENDNEIYF